METHFAGSAFDKQNEETIIYCEHMYIAYSFCFA